MNYKMYLKSSVISVLLLFLILCNTAFCQKDDSSFLVQKSGKGKQSLIFIPGFASSGDVWNETKIPFESNYTCYVLTMPGFAGAPPQVDPSFEKWERAIAEFIRSNNIVKPVIIGHSMGGGLALALAADYPELIGEIIVVDALPCLQALSNPTFKSIANNDCSQSIKQMTEMTEQQFYQMQKMSIPRLLTDTSKQEEVIHWSVMSDRTTFASVYCDFWNVDLREKIKTINCPNLILLESYFVNIKSSVEEQYKGLSNANLKYANKGLHFIMYDDKEWYFSQLTKFLAVE